MVIQVTSYFNDIYEHLVLKETSKKVKLNDIEDILHVTKQMARFLLRKRVTGFGISAPQLGYSKQMFLMATPAIEKQRFPTIGRRKNIDFLKKSIHLTVCINPEFTVTKGDEPTELGVEGCLSIPYLVGLVPRYNKIQVKFQSFACASSELNMSTKKVVIKQYKAPLEGFVSRLFQHELDHLQGIMLLDKIKTMDDVCHVSEIDKLKGDLKTNYDGLFI